MDEHEVGNSSAGKEQLCTLRCTWADLAHARVRPRAGNPHQTAATGSR